MIRLLVDRIRTFHHRVTHGGGADYCPTCDTDIEHSHAVRTLQDMNRELERRIEREGGRDVLKNMVLNREAPSHERHR
jgi:hypothetical protein